MSEDMWRRLGEEGKQKDSEPKFKTEHTVVSGETLSYISMKYYDSADRDDWMATYEANKEVIGDSPNLIKPDQVLKIPER